MIVHVISLFPEQIETFLGVGIMGRAVEKGLLEVRTYFLRDFSYDRHRTVDDTPYGGGEGMILKPEPLGRAIEYVRENLETKTTDAPVVMTSPHGRPLTAAVAREYGGKPEWIVVCGQYGGMDARVAERYAADEVSIGDYVLNGGELPALVTIEAAARFIPGVLGNEDSADSDTFEDGLLGVPRYTRPPEFHGIPAPEVLLSGHHARIEEWKRRRKLELTFRRRPDLLSKIELTDEDKVFLKDLEKDGSKD